MKTCYVAFVAWALLSATASGSFADEQVRPSDEALRTTPWYDADANRVLPVTVDSLSDDTINRESRWLPKAERVQKQATPSTSSNTSTGSSTNGQIFAWLVLAALLLTIVVALVYGFNQADIELGPKSPMQRRLSSAPDEQMIERMQELPAELRHVTGNLREQTQQLIAVNRFDLAIITLFGHQLLMLDHATMLRLSRGKTNGRYVRETGAADTTAASQFQKTVNAFERCYFGRYSLSREEMELLWQDNLRLEEIVHARHEVAA